MEAYESLQIHSNNRQGNSAPLCPTLHPAGRLGIGKKPQSSDVDVPCLRQCSKYMTNGNWCNSPINSAGPYTLSVDWQTKAKIEQTTSPRAHMVSQPWSQAAQPELLTNLFTVYCVVNLYLHPLLLGETP